MGSRPLAFCLSRLCHINIKSVISSKVWQPLPVRIRWPFKNVGLLFSLHQPVMPLCVCVTQLWWIVLSCLSRGSAPVLSLQTIACCISSHRASLLHHTAHLHPPLSSSPPGPPYPPLPLLDLSISVLYSPSSGNVYTFPLLFSPEGLGGWEGVQRHLNASRGSSTVPGQLPFLWPLPELVLMFMNPGQPPRHHTHTTHSCIHMGLHCFQWWRLPLFYLWAFKWLRASINYHALCCRCGIHNKN